MVREVCERGYIALLAVLIIGAAAMAIGTTLLMTGTDGQRVALVHQQSKQAGALAVSCAQEALQRVHDNIAFSGTATVTLGQGDCDYTVTVTAPTIRQIDVVGTVDNVVRKIQVYVTIGTSSISVTSWNEVS